jgi:pyruvate dehydrogenase E2 component (dihydrolipoamide acetyltransferase)
MTSLVEFRLPDIGEGVTEGEIVNWFVAAGDEVAEDDPMVEVMTDKATVTIGAPCEGRIEAIAHEVGSIVPVGEVLVRIQSTDTHESMHESKHEETDAPIKATAVGSLEESLPGAGLFERPVTAFAGALAGSNGELRSTAPAPPIRYFRAKPLATPATRRMAKELGLDLRRIVPSGEGGRVTREDLRAALGQAPEQSVAAGRVSAVSGEAREERVPILGMRRQIAERMHRSKSQAAHFTFVEECDASRLVELRARLEPEAERRGVQLSYLPFIVKAVLQALAAHPVLNSAVDDEARELVYKKYYNIGIATATDAGLMVPVIRGADRMRLFELAREISRLAEAARQGSLRPEELRGGSFTITSLGKRSGLLATPILNYPEVGILGVHRIKDKPVVRDGQIVVGQIMLLSLSFDHRIVDGHVGADFAYEVIDYLQNPEKLFYEYL